MAVEVIEVIKVVEAVEVIEVASKISLIFSTILVIVTQCVLCNRAIVKITVDFPQFDGRNSCTMCIFDMICLFYAILKLAARLLR